MNISAIFRLLRPAQWLKNGFVFLPMFFGGSLLSATCWVEALVAFFSFSFIASAIYCFNDLKDVEADRRHPVKCKRPIASGQVATGLARALIVVLTALSCALALSLPGSRGWGLLCIVIGYFVMNIAYCLKLKQVAIIDVMIISLGFVLRLMAGGVACQITLSPWIVCMTFLLALFLAFAKRRDDVVVYESTGVVARATTARYSLAYLNLILGIIAAVTIVCYVLYTVSPEVVQHFGTSYLYVTSIFVLGGILRYLQLAIVDNSSGSPTKILVHDHFIQACIVLWIVTFAIIIYA